MKLPVTAIVLTLDEELNISHCLDSLNGWCEEIFVVDSGSSDRTLAIAQQAGARIVEHPFQTHAQQWDWALKNLPLSSEWILALDADQRISAPLQQEIQRALEKMDPEVSGYYLSRKEIFRGRWIRHGGYWPKYLLKLFRRGYAEVDLDELVDSRFYVKGETRLLKSPLIEENLKEAEILFWHHKHLRYAGRMAQEELLRRKKKVAWKAMPFFWGSPDQRVLWLKERWYHLPLHVRPFLYFGYRYFLRCGFLDGYPGFIFHFLQGFWLRWVVDLRIQELQNKKKSCSS